MFITANQLTQDMNLCSKEETIDQKLKNMNSLSKNFITAIWVSHFAFFFFGGIALGISVPL